MRLRPVPSSLAITALAALLINGCGGAAGTTAGAGSPGQIGSLTFAIVGAAQSPVTATASYGANVTAIAGALIDRLTLNHQGPGTLEDTKIVFSSNRTGAGDIYSANHDGSSLVRLTNNAAVDMAPVWSPDGSKIAFYSPRSGNFDIYVMNADGSGETRLTTDVAVDFGPCWSPDGSQIAFSSTRDGNYEVYTMNADGTAQTRRTNSAGVDYEPEWAPGSNQIFFTSSRDAGNYEIYSMNALGGAQTRLTNNAAVEGTPSPSFDGKKLVFTSNRDGNYEIYSMNPDGTSQTRLTNTSRTEATPAWSPDGRSICFASFTDSWDVYTMSSTGSDVFQFPEPLGNVYADENPHWSGYLPRTPKTLIGPAGTLGTAAAGFLFGQEGDSLRSIVTFDTTTVGSRSAARVASQTPLETQGSNLIFSVTTSAGLASLSYAPINAAGVPGTAVSPTIPAGSTAALVSFNASTGFVSSVLPYAANRSATKQETSGDNLTYTGTFTAVYNAKGENVATNGASSITLNAKTGELVSYIKN